MHKHVSLLRDGANGPTGIISLVTDVTERKHYEEKISLLMREVSHRSKNMLALVLSVVGQTAQTAPDNFIDRFVERIQALASSQNLRPKSAATTSLLAAMTRLRMKML